VVGRLEGSPVDKSGCERWVCLYCHSPIVEAERRQAPKVILGGMRVGRAHPACKALAVYLERLIRDEEAKA
jgi:hypothetical protein